MSSKMVAVSVVVCLAGLTVAHVGWAQGSPNMILIRNFTFRPATFTVQVGSTLTFKNGDETAHSIIASDGSFRSTDINPGGSSDVSFKKPGTFTFFCGAHPFMEGKVIVTEKAIVGAQAGAKL